MSGPISRDGYRLRKVFVKNPQGLAVQEMQKKPARVPHEELGDLRIQRALSQALRKKE